MSAESLTGLCEEADALALALACENRNVESDTVHRLAAKAKDLDVECDSWQQKYVAERDKNESLKRWSWQTSGSHTLLCRGDAVFAQVWQHDAGEWRMRWIPNGRVENEIISFELAKDMAIQAARSKGKLGAGEVVK
jgi:hypothetical protein